MKIKVVFIDIDGTLIDPKSGVVSAPVQRAIYTMQENGILPVLISGRPAFAVKPLANALSLNTYIAFNGGMIIENEKPIYKNPMEKNTLEQFVAFANERHHPLIFPGHDRYYLALNMHPFIKNMLKNIPSLPIAFEREYWKTNDIYQIEILSPDATLKDYYRKFEKQLRFYPWHILTNATNVLPIKTGKAAAMKKLLNYLSLSRSASAAVGDGPNDIDMLQTARLGIAMGNACSELKNIADFVVADVSEDGLAEALTMLINSR